MQASAAVEKTLLRASVVIQRQPSAPFQPEKYRLKTKPGVGSISSGPGDELVTRRPDLLLSTSPDRPVSMPVARPASPTTFTRLENAPTSPSFLPQLEKPGAANLVESKLPPPVGVVQRIASVTVEQALAGNPEVAPRVKPSVDLQTLAEAVFPIIKRLLAIEAERSGGRFH